MATANLKMSRRKIGDLQADVIFGFVERGGRILWPDGRVFPTPDTLIDDAYQDGDFRMLSDLIKFGVDPKQRPQMRVLTRLRLLSLTFQIAYPDIARHFDR